MSVSALKTAQWVRWAAAPAALVACSAFVWQASQAAFSDTTDNGTNNWSAGRVDVSDDDSNVAMFNASGLKPGDNASRCIKVSYDGSLAANVKLYASASGALASHLNVTVDQGSGGSSGSCTGFASDSTLYSGTLAGFASTASNYASGVGTFAPAGTGEAKTYRVIYTVANDNAAQGATASATFTWEAQNS